MELVNLYDFINILEMGTKLHISVVFLSHYGNEKTQLPFEKRIHSSPLCQALKAVEGGNNRCMRCRNVVLQRVVTTKRPMFGECINGICEYCYPVVFGGEIACVLFIGNIFPRLKNADRLFKGTKEELFSTLNQNLDEERCHKIAMVLDEHITILLKEFDNIKFDPLIENIISYIEENLTYDFKISQIAQIFNYNEKYLGKLFRDKTGMGIKQYINLRRVETAGMLLKQTKLPVTEISLRCGFNNVTYFNKIFKKIKGHSPLQFRDLL